MTLDSKEEKYMSFLEEDYFLVFRGLPLPRSSGSEQLIRFYNQYTEHSLAAMPLMASELTIALGFAGMLNFFRKNELSKVHVKRGCEFFLRLGIDSQHDACERIMRLSDGDGYVYLPSASGVYLALKRAAIHIALKNSVEKKDIIRFFGKFRRTMFTLNVTVEIV